MAGMDWYYCFMARHPEISLRKPEATSLHRILAFNKEETDIFFDNLTQLMLKYRFESNVIYNVDETGISTVQRNSKILAPRGMKQVGKCTSGERGSLTTVINACNAAGSYVPPFFIFKRKRMNPLLMKQSNSNMVASVSDSGWISEQLFIDWLHNFKSFARLAEDNIILLILDNHQSHISLAAYKFCKKNYIHVLTLPPHASHRMQPLDLTFHCPLKTAYNKECESFMVNKPGAKITTFDVVGLYTKAFNRTTNIEKAMNGFKAAGIYPLDKDKFKSTFESLADTTDPRTISVAPRSVASQDPNQSTIDLPTPVSKDVSITIANRNLGDQSDTPCESLDGNESPSHLVPSDLNETDIQAGKSNDLPLPVLEDTAQPTVANLNASIPLSDIINMPSLQSPLKNKTRSLKTSIP